MSEEYPDYTHCWNCNAKVDTPQIIVDDNKPYWRWNNVKCFLIGFATALFIVAGVYI